MKDKILRVMYISALSIIIALAFANTSPVACAKGDRILAEITTVKDSTVYLNQGSSAGVKPGMLFDIYREAKVVYIPMTKEKVLVEEKDVGRVIVTQVSSSSSACEIVKLIQNMTIEKGDTAVNLRPSLAPNINAPPVIENLNISKTEARTGDEIVIDCVISDVNDKFHIYTWSCDNGQLSAKETTTGSATWLCPEATSEAMISVTVTDPHGASATSSRKIKCLGPGPRGTLFRPNASFGESTPRFRKINYAAFDDNNHMIILDSLEKRLITLSDDFNVDKVSALYGDEYSFKMAKVSGSYLYAVDSISGSLIKYKYEGDIFRRKPETVYGARGTGNGYFGSIADFQVGSNGMVYILDKSACAIHVFSNNGTFNCSIGRRGDMPGEMRLPISMALDLDGNLYVGEYARRKILKFAPNNQFVEEYDLNGKLGTPVCLRYSRRHDYLVVLEREPHIIRLISTTGQQKTVLENPDNPLAVLNDPQQLTVSSTGEIYVVSGQGSTLQMFSSKCNLLGKMGGEKLGQAKAFTVTPEGDMYILESLKNYVYMINRNGWITARFGGLGPNKEQFKSPAALCSDDDGNAYVLDTALNQILKFSRDGKFLNTIGTPGTEKDQVQNPIDLYSIGEKLYLLQYCNRWCVLVFNKEGRLMQLYPDKESETSRPAKIAVDKKGNSFIFTRGYQIEFFNRDGAKVSGARNVNSWLNDVAVGPRGDIFAVSAQASEIIRIDPTRAGALETYVSSPAAKKCAGIEFDNYGRMYIFDETTKVIVRFSESNK